MDNTRKQINSLSYQVVGAAIEVHRHLGPGLLESIYLKCLCLFYINNILNFMIFWFLV